MEIIEREVAKVGAPRRHEVLLLRRQHEDRLLAELAQERLSKRHVQDATVGARIYDPDGAAEIKRRRTVVKPRPPHPQVGVDEAERE